jgi:hypothetical protein
VGGFSIITAGTGYRVGDLVTKGDSLVQFFNSFVLRVDAVGILGEVTQFTMLSPGCFTGDLGVNSTIDTSTIVGTGLTLKRWATVATGTSAIYNWNTQAYYNYDPPQLRLVAPLQVANYTLRRVTIGTTSFTVLQLDSPEFPIAITNGLPAPRLRFELYQFTPHVPELLSYYFFGHTFPLTQRNLEALHLEEYDNTCFRTQNPLVCFLDGARPFYTTPMNLNSLRVYTHYYPSSPALYDNSITWTYKSQQSVHDYALNGTVFTLLEPLRLVLPSL